jgi:hypothetical protein
VLESISPEGSYKPPGENVDGRLLSGGRADRETGE